jgi:hypothetical protein
MTSPHSFNKADGASSGQLSQTQSWREADDPKLFSQTARGQMFALRMSFETKPNPAPQVLRNPMNQRSSATTPVALSGDFSTDCDTWNTTGWISARRTQCRVTCDRAIDHRKSK